jgi:hypothetical protein
MHHSVRDASVISGLSDYEIREAINRGELKARRRGRRILIPDPWLNEFMRSLPTTGDAA